MKPLLAIASATMLAAGCAKVAVTDDALATRTALALGLALGTFKITDRLDQAVSTQYEVISDSGQRYQCSILVISREIARCDKHHEPTPKLQSDPKH